MDSSVTHLFDSFDLIGSLYYHCPILLAVDSLARQAGLQPNAFTCLSKPQLFQRLKEQWNFERLQRAQSRSVKRKTDEEVPSCNAWMSGRRATRRSGSSSSGGACAAAAPQPKKRQKLNTIDPILLTEIGKHKVSRQLVPEDWTGPFYPIPLNDPRFMPCVLSLLSFSLSVSPSVQVHAAQRFHRDVRPRITR